MKINENLTIKDIFKKISQEDIMNRYFGEPVMIGKKYRNPFRSELGLSQDNDAGCFFKYTGSGKLLFYDFATERISYDCFDIAGLRTGAKFFELLNLIQNDLSIYSNQNLFTPREKSDTIIKVRTVPFAYENLKWWNQYAITKSILGFFDVKKCSRTWINGAVWKDSREDNPIYRYRQKDRITLYLPFESREDKWRNNYTGGLLNGWNQLPYKGKICFLQKGFKDTMSMYAFSYTSVGARGETILISENAFELLKKRFDIIIPYMDNDATGLKMLAKYKEVFNLDGICNPIGKPKDSSDWVKENAIEWQKWLKGTI
jgi:hypothetical protein